MKGYNYKIIQKSEETNIFYILWRNKIKSELDIHLHFNTLKRHLF